jgi:ATP-binding cassette subfamily B protein
MARYCVGPAMATDWEEETPAQIDRHLIARAFSHFLPYWRRGVVSVAAIAVGAVLGLAPALIAKKLIDHLSAHNVTFSYIAMLVAAGLAASILNGIVNVGGSYLSTSISQGIMADLRWQLFDRLLGHSVGFFTRSRTGDVMSRINNDVGRIEDVVSDTIFGVVRAFITLGTTLAFMFILDWRLTLVAMVALPLSVVPSRYIGRASYRAHQRTQRKLAEMSVYLQEVLGISGMLLVKAFAKERSERERFQRLNRELRRLEVRQEMISNWYGVLLTGLTAAGPAIVWLYGGYRVIHHQSSLGTVVTLGTVLTMRLYGSVANLGNLNVNVLGSLALFQRLFEYLDLPHEVADTPQARPLAKPRGAIAFENVSFSYSNGAARPALEQVSFAIEPGQLVALVGPSGAGKTTTSYLIPRFYDPTSGTVRIDGRDLRQTTLESIGQNVGVVFQDTFLWHASIRDNLLYARPGASEDELEAAANAAHLHEFIRTLPDGYDTIVGERGHRLSGGEKQRMAIARVILKNSPILILDEATSHLDTLSEQLIQAALRPLFAGRTSIVIAHRLSTILAADTILVFDHGQVVEQGDHSTLVARGGLYARLYERQFLNEGSEPRVAALA